MRRKGRTVAGSLSALRPTKGLEASSVTRGTWTGCLTHGTCYRQILNFPGQLELQPLSTENAIGPDDRGPAPAGNHPERDQLPVPFLFLEKA